MAIPRFTFSKNDKKDVWELKDSSGKVKKEFDTKAEGIAGGVLERAVGPAGGSVRIQKLDGKIQEERTYPGSADPKKSPG